MLWLGIAFALGAATRFQGATTAPATQSATQSETQPDRDVDDLDPSIERALDEVDQKASKIKDLKAKFQQSKHTALLKKPMQSEGMVRIVASPDRSVMRWDTKEPSAVTTWISPDELRIYSPQQALLEIYPIDAAWSQLATSPLPKLKALREQFTIQSSTWAGADDLAPASAGGSMHLSLRLVPKDTRVREHVYEVRILIDRGVGCVIAAEVLYPDDDRLELQFSDIQINRGVQAEDLDLEVPKGTTLSRPLEAEKRNP